MKNDKLILNEVKLNRLTDTEVNTSAGGVNFYEGVTMSPAQTEAINWINCIVNDTDPVVLPEQALVVSEILEAIYTSSKTGKPVYFN